MYDADVCPRLGLVWSAEAPCPQRPQIISTWISTRGCTSMRKKPTILLNNQVCDFHLYIAILIGKASLGPSKLINSKFYSDFVLNGLVLLGGFRFIGLDLSIFKLHVFFDILEILFKVFVVLDRFLDFWVLALTLDNSGTLCWSLVLGACFWYYKLGHAFWSWKCSFLV